MTARTTVREIGTAIATTTRGLTAVARDQMAVLARSRRGRALGLLAFAGGSLPGVARAWIAGACDGGRVGDASAYAGSLAGVFGADAARGVAAQPAALVLLAALTLLMLPAVLLAAGFDVIGADRRRETATPTMVLGRWLGLWASAAAAMLLAHGVVWLAVIAGGGLPSAVLATGLRFWLACAAAALPYAALAVLASAVSARAWRSLLLGVAVVLALWFVRAGGLLPGAVAALVLPGAHDAALLVGAPRAVLLAVGALGLWATGSLTMSVGLLRWRTR